MSKEISSNSENKKGQVGLDEAKEKQEKVRYVPQSTKAEAKKMNFELNTDLDDLNTMPTMKTPSSKSSIMRD